MDPGGICREVFMVRPVRFEFNYQTAHDNVFQQEPMNGLKGNTQPKALQEFDGMVQVLRDHKIDVTVGTDTLHPHTPDSIFPTNWVSSLPDGTLAFYPMEAKNRQLERKPELISLLKSTFNFTRLLDWTHYEAQGKYLEGAGSIIVDYFNQVAYACLSGRTHKDLVQKVADDLGIASYVMFEAKDENGVAIYHTDVMMCIGDRYACVCLESIADLGEKELLIATLEATGKEVIPITLLQLRTFVGNMVQLQNSDGEKFLVMSTGAFKSLTEGQRSKLEGYNQILHSDLSTIEEVGGGSAQCLMAKIYLNRKKQY